MTNPLPPYSGDSSPCPKCGKTGPTTKWKRAMSPGPATGEWWTFLDPVADLGPERLRRTCERCGYWWDEAPVLTTSLLKHEQHLTANLDTFTLAGDENGGVALLCRPCDSGGLPIAYYGWKPWPDPTIPTVNTITDLLAAAHTHHCATP